MSDCIRLLETVQEVVIWNKMFPFYSKTTLYIIKNMLLRKYIEFLS